MANNYALYAVPSDDVKAMRKRVEELLGYALVGVSSDTWGLYYTTRDWSENAISVYQNFNPSEHLWNAPEHTGFPLLLSIADAPEMDKFHQTIMKDKNLGAVLVKLKDYEADNQEEET